MKKNLKYFMHPKETKIVTMPGPSSFVDEDGKVLDFEIKVLSQAEINKINDAYHRRYVATDKKGNPIINGNEVVWKDERDNTKASRHLVAEALQYPDLKDPELMKYYDCYDIADMPLHVFPNMGDYLYVLNMVMNVLGINTTEEQYSEDVEDAKN